MTMDWHHHLCRNQKWITGVYGGTSPTLRACRLAMAGITDNNDMILAVHIKQMPPEHLWPKRWDRDCNRVEIELSIGEIRAVCVQGWSANNVTDVEFHHAEDGRQSLALTASGAWGRITATFGWLSVNKIKGYRAEEDHEGQVTTVEE
jgi:hypothetical protein